MAIERINDTVRFYYEMDALFDKQSLFSMYATVSKGDEAVENFAITDDEKDVATALLEDAVYDVFNRFLKYTGAISDAIGFNEPFTPQGEPLIDNATWLSINDNDSFNENILKPIDALIEKTLRFKVLKEWFLMRSLEDSALYAGNAYNENLKGLLRHAFNLKIKKVF
jgi:hypothetical protein